VRRILSGLGFEAISITRKDNSEKIIKSWNLGKGVENIAFSAYIRADKPLNRGD